MNPSRWRHIAETYADIGMLPHNFSLDGFPQHNLALSRPGGMLLLTIVVAPLIVLRKSKQMNREL